MSKETVTKFYDAIFESQEFKQEIKVITRHEELIKLGARNGFYFTMEDLAEAGASYIPQNNEPLISIDSDDSARDKSPRPYHYEFEFSEIPGFEEIDRELKKLHIKPSTVDLDLYEKSFREEDFKFNYVSPTAPGFRQYYYKSLKSYLDLPSPQPEYAWRPFHLINLDCYVEDPLYEDYFQTKVKLLQLLENCLSTEMRFSGSLWYPPNAYRLWHTNETQPGWRMYLVDFDCFEENKEGEVFFRYMNPETKELVTLAEKPKVVRFFKIESEPSKLLWHCIVNTTKLNRWSFGFNVSSKWMDKLLTV